MKNAPAPRERPARHAEPSLPPLRVRPAAGVAPPARRAEPADPDPQRRALEDDPLPPRRKRGDKDDDEDLLP